MAEIDEGVLPLDGADAGDLTAFDLTFPPLPVHPFLRRASGTYVRTASSRHAPPLPAGAEDGDGGADPAGAEPGAARPPVPALPTHETLRVDVDGSYPQMQVSSTSTHLLRQRTWIAAVERRRPRTGRWEYEGPIWYTDGYPAGTFPYTSVLVAVDPPSLFGSTGSARVRLTGPGGVTSTATYAFSSRSFHPVDLEHDVTEDAEPVMEIGTHDHPVRPAALRGERLSISTVFRRAGFAVTESAGSGSVPLTGTGVDGVWSDAEMHDAMQSYWSRFADAPQWALWTFWARLSDRGTRLGGIMFDDIGPNHRQGTAVFTGSFIRDVPPGDPAPDAWDRRMRFWTAVHEMGHAFNLAHSWQKDLPGFGSSWVPLANAPEERSFMNYPYNVAGGQAAFFADFPFRFSDDELTFLRHAPARFVQQGDADWFDHHALEESLAALPPAEYRLQVRANRVTPVFEFLEPVVLELKLTSTGTEPKIVHADVLDPQHAVTVVQREGAAPRQWVPYARTCTRAESTVLMPGASTYAALPVFAGRNGWDVSEPGTYRVTVVVEVDGRPVRSEPFSLRVLPPRTFEEQRLAGDLLTDRVGRALAFGGTGVDTVATDVLHETVETVPGSRAAIHAAAALARPLARAHKVLVIPDAGAPLTSVAAAGGSVTTRAADVDAALAVATRTVGTDEAAETLGHIGARRYADGLSDDLAAAGATQEAASLERRLHHVLAGRGVLPAVLEAIEAKADALAAGGDGVPTDDAATGDATADDATATLARRTPR